jgi:hypothetical protein
MMDESGPVFHWDDDPRQRQDSQTAESLPGVVSSSSATVQLSERTPVKLSASFASAPLDKASSEADERALIRKLKGERDELRHRYVCDPQSCER